MAQLGLNLSPNFSVQSLRIKKSIGVIDLCEREIEALGLCEVGQRNQLMGIVIFNLSDPNCLILKFQTVKSKVDPFPLGLTSMCDLSLTNPFGDDQLGWKPMTLESG